MQQLKTVRFTVDDHIATIVLARPERRNALSITLATELTGILKDLVRDSEVRAVVITGEGSAFCSGADLKDRREMTPEDMELIRERILEFVALIDRFPSPVIAMINGPAVAGGFELALSCDIRVASDAAFFSLTEVKNVGAFPGAGGPLRLARLVGKGKAKLITLTGRRFSAKEALDLGFVELVVPAARLHEEVYALARELTANSPLGVRAAKLLINEGTEIHSSGGATLSQALRAPLDRTRDHDEALAAWHEKRQPQFVGH